MKTEALADTVKKITLDNGNTITLIGTAHVSKNSVEDVERIMNENHPDMVCIELDKGRYSSKTEGKKYSDTSLRKIFKEGKTFLVLANTALASFQKKMGAQTGISPGEEILSAAKIAQEKGIPFTLCDRDITVTLKRAWAKSSLWNKAKLLGALISSAFDKEEIKPEELEELKKGDSIENMMGELAKELPQAKEALIDERDRYLATSIYKCEGKNKVAVIGAGHAGGIIKTIEKLEKNEIKTDLSDISTVPKPSKLGKIAGWIIPAAIIAFVVYSCITYGFDQGIKYFLLWAASNAGGAMLFAILSNAHPLNWLVAAISAPIAVMNPLVGVGVFTGIAESELRKPTVNDFEKISDDISSFKGWYKNRVLHAFLVFIATSIGSILGTFVIFPIVMKFFG
ncbi:MAG: TraB/GumN family protein [Sphaerochaetaceae bacterium]|nr:TraB/GumN family protein [Sphaerochaetaceae bacterium]